jgi:ATP-dependent DNA helicase HFM1/MER3
MAPIKALVSIIIHILHSLQCQEKTQDWTQKFSTIGLVCKEVTGDSEIDNVEFNFRNVDVILTTPEKWDSMSRKWKDYGMMQLMSQVALMLIDEVHLLNEGRGAVLEAVVSRMKLMRASAEMADRPSAKLRFIAVRLDAQILIVLQLSATIPNIEDIAEWLEAPEEATLNFGEEYRPIKLDVKVVGVNNTSKSQFLFEKNLNFKLLPIIQEYSSGKPTIVFCSTRKSASEAAVFLAKEGGTRNGFIQNESHRDRLVLVFYPLIF